MSSSEEKESLKSKAVKGILWGGFSNGIQQLLGLIFGIYLSRTLDAKDYGLVGILTIFTLIAASIQEGGFINALANKKNAEFKDYNAVFWTSLMASLSLYVILFFAAPFISAFFDIPELTILARVLFLGFVCGSLGIAHSAYLFKNLKVKERSLATTLSVLISGVVAILFAYFGFSYWSIVAQTITYSFCFSLICFLFSDFRPSLNIDFTPIRHMWKFSSKILITNIVNHINNNILTLYLGRVSSKETVGYYAQANKWSAMAQGVVANMSHGFAQPMLSTLKEDQDRQRRIFLKLLNFICFATFPALTLLHIVSKEFILITITEKWLSSVYLLQILCIQAAFLPIINFYANYILSKGSSSLYMLYIVAFGLIQLTIIFFLHPHGIIPLVWGMAFFTAIWAFVWQISISRYANINYFNLSWIILRYLAVSVVCGVLAYFFGERYDNVYLSLFIKALVFIFTYLAVMYIFKSVILREIILFMKEKYVNIQR